MRGIRTISIAAMLSAALFGVSSGITYAAPGSTFKDVVLVTAHNDSPLVDGQTYTLSYNSSGSGGKVSGGFTLSGPDGFVLGGKTTAICQDPTRIINSVNPPKKGSVQGIAYLIITVDEAGNETIDVVQVGKPVPVC